jgi:hypothetical protein
MCDAVARTGERAGQREFPLLCMEFFHRGGVSTVVLVGRPMSDACSRFGEVERRERLGG